MRSRHRCGALVTFNRFDIVGPLVGREGLSRRDGLIKGDGWMAKRSDGLGQGGFFLSPVCQWLS